MCSGTPRSLPLSSMSTVMDTRTRGRSAGSAPLRSMRSMASLRLTAALTEDSRQMGSSVAAAAASRSRARTVGVEARRSNPSGVAQPGLVGEDEQEAAGLRPVPEPPEPLGEPGAVGGETLPDDADGPPVGKGDGGVHRHGAVPAEADGVFDVGDGGGQAVDDGHGVEPFQEDAPPPGRHRVAAEQAVRGEVFLPGQAAQAVSGEVEPAGGGNQLRPVGD